MSPAAAPQATLDALLDAGARRLELLDRNFLTTPLDPLAAFPRNAYITALYEPRLTDPAVTSRSAAGDLLLDYQWHNLAGWMLHLPWAKNPAPMNRSGARGGWRDAARQGQHVRETAFQLVRGRIPRQRRIRVRLDWHVTTRRTRDEDNLVRCMKHLVDGIRLAGVVDDDDRTYVLRNMPEIHYQPEADGGYPHMRLYILTEP